MPDLTAEDFYNSQEHVEIAQADGWGLSPAAQAIDKTATDFRPSPY